MLTRPEVPAERDRATEDLLAESRVRQVPVGSFSRRLFLRRLFLGESSVATSPPSTTTVCSA